MPFKLSSSAHADDPVIADASINNTCLRLLGAPLDRAFRPVFDGLCAGHDSNMG
jgi:hypothetical protein